jgi:hypothetical protein
MSSEFVVAFVQECAAQGLTKEATAELLQFQSIVSAAEQSPAFAEGFEKFASQVPGGLRPLFRDGYMEKSAAGFLTALKKFGPAIGSLYGTSTGLAGAGLQLGLSGVNKLKRFIRARPVLSSAGALTAGGAGAYGLSKLLSSDHSTASDVPYISGASYNPVESGKSYNALLDQYSNGVTGISNKLSESAGRKKVLEEAIAKHDVSSPMAIAELQRLNKESETASKAREDYMKRYSQNAESSEKRLADLEQKRNDIIDAKTDWAHMPARAWYHLTGRNPNDVYDKQLRDVEGPLSQAATSKRLNQDLYHRLDYGYNGNKVEDITPQQVQSKFFKTTSY